MDKYIISVVSYKRPNNNTCKMLLNCKSLNWSVYVYSFDPYIEDYKKLYGAHVYEITQFDKANLSKKRQLVLDNALKNNYEYCIMLDDDINSIQYLNKDTSLFKAILFMLKNIRENKKYVALSAAYNLSNTTDKISKYKNICNNSIFNLNLYKKSNVKYNENSKCEDMEFSIELMLKGYLTGKIEELIIKNELQGGLTNDGLSYRFKNTNRFIEEGEYMSNKFSNIKDVFEYDEYHFKLNSKKLVKYLNKLKK